MQHIIWPENSSVNSERNRVSTLDLFNAFLYSSFVKSVLHTSVSSWKQMSLPYYLSCLSKARIFHPTNCGSLTPGRSRCSGLETSSVTGSAHFWQVYPPRPAAHQALLRLQCNFLY